MAVRFHKSVKLFKGLRLNFSKSGTSWSVGGKGHSVNIGKKGTQVTTGIPGTGISYRHKVSKGRDIDESAERNIRKPQKHKTWLWVLGWLFVFPLPLTLLLLRKKGSGTIFSVVKYALVLIAWLLYLFFVFTYNDLQKKESAENTEGITTAVTLTDTVDEEKDKVTGRV